MNKIGIASPLPPARGGPADYVSHLLPFLARHLEIVCFVPEPEVVDGRLSHAFEIRGIDRVADPDVDLMLYQIANNAWHRDVVEAARAGPPGVAVLHDATIHNIYYDMFLHEGARDLYHSALVEAHGSVGASLAELRMAGETGEVDLYLFDLIGPLVKRQLGAIVHSRWAHDFVSERVPSLPIWIIPHYAIGEPHPVARRALGVPSDRFVVTHLGVVTRSKRPDLLLASVAELLSEDVSMYVVFAGQDLSGGLLDDAIQGFDLAQHVTVTGFLSEDTLDAHACAADVIVSLRWPHMGESSGTLMRALRAGKPVVTQKLGTWAELPPYAVVSVPDGPDEVGALADILDSFRRDPRLRRRTGDAGRLYAASIGGADRAAELYTAALRDVLAGDRRSPLDVMKERARKIHSFLEETKRPFRDVLRRLPPAHRGGRLLWLGDDPGVLSALIEVWGWDACHEEGGGRLPHPAGSFDVAIAASTADPGDRRVLAEINRVLRAGGLLVAEGTTDGPGILASGFSEPQRSPSLRAGWWEARKVTLPSLELAPIP